MLGLGTIELVIIGCISVMLFGSRLPTIARSAGASIMEFKRGFMEVEKECRKLEAEA